MTDNISACRNCPERPFLRMQQNTASYSYYHQYCSRLDLLDSRDPARSVVLFSSGAKANNKVGGGRSDRSEAGIGGPNRHGATPTLFSSRVPCG
jgi:hypothetical protein